MTPEGGGDLQRTVPLRRSTQYTVSGELSGGQASPEHEILRLRAQNDRVLGGAHLTTSRSRSAQWSLSGELSGAASTYLVILIGVWTN